MTGAAVAAAGAGAWLSWRRIAPQPVLSGAEAAFWAGNFEGPNGEAVNLAAMRGRPLLVNFWATWCPPCIRELPDLNAFHLAHTNDRITVVGVSVDEGGANAVRAFVERNNLAYPVGMVTPEMSADFGAQGPIPATYVIDRRGHFAARYLGSLTREELERVTRPLVLAPAQ